MSASKRRAARPSRSRPAAAPRPRAAAWLSGVALIIGLAGVGTAAGAEYRGRLPDFEADRFNAVLDARTGDYLRPGLPGEVFEWPTAAPVDWDGDGLFDLVVGYNLRRPDVIRMVVYINQGRPGAPSFTGVPSPDTCFYVEVTDPGGGELRVFEGPGRHWSHRWLVHRPAVLDLDGDGRFDLLVNESTYDLEEGRGQWLLLNRGRIGAPRFEAFYLHDEAVVAKLPAGPYREALELLGRQPEGVRGHYPAFNVVDWDSDGVPDISYSLERTFIMYGAAVPGGGWRAREPRWEEVQPVGADRFALVARLVTVDFDGDGVNEVLVADPTTGEVPDGRLRLFVRDRDEPGRVRYRLADGDLFSLNGDHVPWWKTFWFPRHGWWHPRVTPIDFDEDGDPDILAGWGGGNEQRQRGERMYLYRTPGGVAGSRPMYEQR